MAKAKTKTKTKTNKTPSVSKAAPERKSDKLIALLKRDGGATLVEITEATGWLPHSARAMLTGLRKKGFTLDKVKIEDVTRYSITAEPAA